MDRNRNNETSLQEESQSLGDELNAQQGNQSPRKPSPRRSGKLGVALGIAAFLVVMVIAGIGYSALASNGGNNLVIADDIEQDEWPEGLVEPEDDASDEALGNDLDDVDDGGYYYDDLYGDSRAHDGLSETDDVDEDDLAGFDGSGASANGLEPSSKGKEGLGKSDSTYGAEDTVRNNDANGSRGDKPSKGEGATSGRKPSSGSNDASSNATPDFTVYNEQGEAVQLSDYVGKPVVVNFWATWCPNCVSEMEGFQRAYERYGYDVQFLMVNMIGGGETRETVDEYITRNGFTFPVFFDDDLSATYAYRLYAIPESLFIDADGNIQAMAAGPLNADSLEEGIQMILP